MINKQFHILSFRHIVIVT